MHKNHAKILLDPGNLSTLKTIIYEEDNNKIINGLLYNHTNWFPIIQGIPRMLISSLKDQMLLKNVKFLNQFQSRLPYKVRQYWQSTINKQLLNTNKYLSHQIQTGDSFAYEWNNIYQENSYERNNFLHFLSPFTKKKDLKSKLILDAGCGSGRFTKQAGLMGSKLCVGMDLGESVVGAYRLTDHLPNVLIVQADIYHPPFKNIFDLIFSIGVLHHLPEPKKGFLTLATKTKPGGKITIWVYDRLHNNRAIYLYEPLRIITKFIPKPILYKLCFIPALIVHVINLLTKSAKNPPFGYYRNFSFNMKLNDAFDVLATPKSNYYYPEQLLSWYQEAKLNNAQTYDHPEAGITAIGIHGK